MKQMDKKQKPSINVGAKTPQCAKTASWRLGKQQPSRKDQSHRTAQSAGKGIAANCESEPLTVENGAAPKQTIDPAILIGLAILFGRNGGKPTVPELIARPLAAAASDGCGASRVVLGWLDQRAEAARTKLKPVDLTALKSCPKPNVLSILGGHHG